MLSRWSRPAAGVSLSATLLLANASCSQRTIGSVIQAGIPTTSAPKAPAAAVIPTAERYIGTPYKWGGNTPSSGFDCSGYTKYVFAKHGVNIPRTSRTQALTGSPVRLTYRDLLPGDLVMFAETGKPISHVAIYAGDDRILHSSKSGAGVRYDDLRSHRGQWFVNHMVVARRIVPAAQGRGIVRDLVKELRTSGVKLDLPSIRDAIGDLAPKP